mgnify:CR=1 FL=1
MKILMALVLISAFGCSLFAQSKTIRPTFKSESLSFQIIPTACGYPACDQAIKEVKEQYQQQANETCQDIFICITCCNKEWVVYALVLVKPDPIHCPIVENLTSNIDVPLYIIQAQITGR